MSYGITFRNYTLISFLFTFLITLYGIYKNDDFYSRVEYLSTEKLSLGIFYNLFLVIFLIIGETILVIFIGPLRDLEIEQLVENGRGFLLDTVLFIVLSSPTIDGKVVSTYGLIKYICILITLKTFHLIVQIRVTHIFEIGIPDFRPLFRLFCLILLLLFTDLCTIPFFYKGSTKNSTFNLWLLFESIGMLTACTISLVKYGVHLIDLRMENGWPSKSAFIFYLSLISDIISLVVYLFFILLYFFNNPSRLPMFVTVDVIQLFRTLLLRLRSFIKYRKLAKNLNERFPDATFEELEDADTCIICRDHLYEGSKKLPCSHIFHVECLKSWLVQQQTCPTCRTEILADDTRLENANLITENSPENISNTQEADLQRDYVIEHMISTNEYTSTNLRTNLNFQEEDNESPSPADNIDIEMSTFCIQNEELSSHPFTHASSIQTSDSVMQTRKISKLYDLSGIDATNWSQEANRIRDQLYKFSFYKNLPSST